MLFINVIKIGSRNNIIVKECRLHNDGARLAPHVPIRHGFCRKEAPVSVGNVSVLVMCWQNSRASSQVSVRDTI